MFNSISAATSLVSPEPLTPVGGGGLLNIPSALDGLMPHPLPFPCPCPPPPPPLGGGLLGPGQLGNVIGEVLGPGGSGGILGPGQLGNVIGAVLGGCGGGLLGPGQLGNVIGELLGGGGGVHI